MKITKLKYLLLSVLTLVSLTVFSATSVLAASGTVKASGGGSVNIGDTVNITIKFDVDEPLYGIEFGVDYDENVLEFIEGDSAYGGGGLVRVGSSLIAKKSGSFILKFKAIAPGKSSINIINDEPNRIIASGEGDNSEIPMTGSGTSVTVKAPGNYSKDNSLKSLKVSPGTLSPAFKYSTTRYTVKVPNNTTKLVVDAQVSNEKAKIVEVTGHESLSVGNNEVKIVVEAESGDRAIYTLVVTRESSASTTTPTITPEPTPPEPTPSLEEPLIPLDVDGKSLYIDSDFDESHMPESFIKTTLNYNGRQVSAASSLSGELSLLYLVDEDRLNGEFYIYNQETKIISDYMEVEAKGGRYIMIPFDDSFTIPDIFVGTTFQVDANDINGWKLDGVEGDSFYIVYAMDPFANKDLYTYDPVNKTLQRFSMEIMNLLLNKAPTEENDKEPVSEAETDENLSGLKGEYEEALSFRHKIIIGLAILSAILLIVLLNLLLRNKYLKQDLDGIDDLYLAFDADESLNHKVEDKKDKKDDIEYAASKTPDLSKDVLKSEDDDFFTEKDEMQSKYEDASLEEIFEFLNVEDIEDDNTKK